MICRRYLFRYRYSLEYLYTLEEMFDEPAYINEVPSISLYTDLCDSFMDDYWASGVGSELWNYIYLTYRDHIAIITDKQVDWNADRWEVTPDFWKHFWGIWKRTHTYYEKMITLLKDNETKLLAQISSSTESDNRFNNTPDQSGDYSGLDYATTINKNKITTSSDAGTILERLEEVRRRYTDYYEKWAREFNKLFISPLNYESSKTLEEFY